jgi:acylglycerol lipase
MEAISFSSEGFQLSGVLWEPDSIDLRAVIFCHGAFEFQENWYPFAERLKDEGYTCFTFDFVGHGQSEGRRNMVDLKTWAYNLRDAMNLLQSRGYKCFAVVGFGIGGSAALLAAAHDRRIKSIVLLSTPVLLIPSLAERIAYGVATSFAKLKKVLYKKEHTISMLTDMDELQLFFDSQDNEAYFSDHKVREIYGAIPIPASLDRSWMDITKAVKKVKTAVLIIHADADKMISSKQANKIYDLLPGKKEIHLLGESGHAIHLDHQKEQAYKLMARWIKKNLDK